MGLSASLSIGGGGLSTGLTVGGGLLSFIGFHSASSFKHHTWFDAVIADSLKRKCFAFGDLSQA